MVLLQYVRPIRKIAKRLSILRDTNFELASPLLPKGIIFDGDLLGQVR